MIIRELNIIGADFIILSYYKIIELDNNNLIGEIIKFYNQLKNRIIENNQFQILLTDIKENLFKTKFNNTIDYTIINKIEEPIYKINIRVLIYNNCNFLYYNN
jgi:hypothetical protein